MSRRTKLRFINARENNVRVNAIFRAFTEQERRWRERGFDIDRRWGKLEKQMDVLRQERKQLEEERYRAMWFSRLIEPLAKMIAEALEARTGVKRTYELFGPFGLECEVAVHFYKVGVTDKKKFNGDNCLSITFRPGSLDVAELFVVDYTKDINKYPKGSIGQVNGLNYPSVPVKQDLEFLLGFVR